jgi:hypothetical protein
MDRDKRLKGIVLNAERTNLPSQSFDIALVQDGLHHLSSPVQGFTEMLRVAKRAVVFLEPHDSLVGRMIGTQWEKNGSAINYVFRWDKKLVDQVASSFLGPNSFDNLSLSFWHHNVVYAKARSILGGRFGLMVVRSIKYFFDRLIGRLGNQFCGLVIKR